MVVARLRDRLSVNVAALDRQPPYTRVRSNLFTPNQVSILHIAQFLVCTLLRDTHLVCYLGRGYDWVGGLSYRSEVSEITLSPLSLCHYRRDVGLEQKYTVNPIVVLQLLCQNN